ncbi:MAG: SUMF1/EgtB/PvdO family nonheme iron enzyme, partial [Gemmataceae bacterium]|nr:SUMF1/EgtB/PvdO family nonheme iron enzyme [Gemmataceae bacterium]
AQVAEGLGLQQAHELGMVHRDIKPENVMVASQGEARILDFGLAKVASEEDDTALTGSGMLLGTPHYMAPEQALDAKRADIRADVYSLGCLLFFLLAGEPPFKGSSAYAILDAHQRQPVPPPQCAGAVGRAGGADDGQVPRRPPLDAGRRDRGAPRVRRPVPGPGRGRCPPAAPACRRYPPQRSAPAPGAPALAARPCRPRRRGCVAAARPPWRKKDPALRTLPDGLITNSIGMRLVPIPEGAFLRGSPEDAWMSEKDEQPQREIRLTAYWLGAHEVKQGQYVRVMGDNPSRVQEPGPPVERVAWKEAVAFCEKLSALPEEQEAGRAYRLPTEAEWERACRAGEERCRSLHTGKKLLGFANIHDFQNSRLPRGDGPPLARIPFNEAQCRARTGKRCRPARRGARPAPLLRWTVLPLARIAHGDSGELREGQAAHPSAPSGTPVHDPSRDGTLPAR